MKTKKYNNNKIKYIKKRGKNTRRIKQRSGSTYKTHRIYNGGTPRKSGSYGCVFFKPALKCHKNKSAEIENGISKLMEEYSAKTEFDTIMEVKSHIKDIPNNNDYFLVNDIKMCTPDKLSNEDLNDFDTVCNDIVKYTGYDKNIINNNLKHFKIINMPYGGIDLNEFWKKMMHMSARDKKKTFFEVNSILIRLLVNGIVPLNQTGFYHLDVKGGNILISDDLMYARLIDWGISRKLNENNITTSKFIQEFQFNIPITNILFNLNINKWLKDELNSLNIKNIKTISLSVMKTIVKNIILSSMKDKGEGHYMIIIYYIIVIYNLDDTMSQDESTNFAADIICTFISTALMKYMDSEGVFQFKKYCSEIYLSNVDVWGFIMSYIQIIIYEKETNGPKKYKKEFIKSISDIIINYCYNPKYAVLPIPVDNVISDLQNKIVF